LNASNYIRTSLIFIVTALTAQLTGCQTTPEVKSASYEIRADADPVVNRDISGKPLSVVVRLYQLKKENEFSQLTFDVASSGRTDAELFGENMLQRSELVLLPGSTNVRKETLLPETKYLGVIAYFRRPDLHYWRYLIDANLVREKGLNLQAMDCYLRLNNIPALQIPGQPRDAFPICQSDTLATQDEGSVLVPPAATAPEKPRTVTRTRPVQPTTVTTPKRVTRPATVLPTPPEPVAVKPVVSTPTINVNVTPTLGLPKWGGQ